MLKDWPQLLVFNTTQNASKNRTAVSI